MHPDLEKLVSRGKIDSLTAEQLELLPPGTFCQHKSWGAGKVVDWDRLGVKVVVDFEDGHAEAERVRGDDRHDAPSVLSQHISRGANNHICERVLRGQHHGKRERLC
ncbi:MAG: hypothetical protein NWQ95_00560, partial [Verrucomicrobiales bacterium]|nr:hypothetical protein [Verrucomicrobiales bacterium]